MLFGILKFDLKFSQQLALKMDKFRWLLKTPQLVKYPSKIKNHIYFAQSFTQWFKNNCILSKLFFHLK